ncbi:MAG TPA: serine--tRNA ligase [Candidatus Latescibacteria bacterium]|nr:serine--tRNA ligase [Candidatus Latescibacterota bacterium]
MLDLKFIRKNPDLVREGARKKGMNIRLDEILKLDEGRRKLIGEVEGLRAAQKKANLEMRERPERKEGLIQEMKQVSQDLKEAEALLKRTEESLNALLLEIPNLPHESVPEGKDETENVVVRRWGEPKDLGFKPKDHVTLGQELDIIDIGRASKVSGTRFCYLKNEAVLLEFALIHFAFNLLIKEGFIPVIPPILAREEIFFGMGYLPSADQEMYKTTPDNMRLAATSEQTLGPLHRDEILDGGRLPLRYAGFSSCFRREAGSYGKDVRGIFRVHQFDKVEMFSFCRKEQSWDEHEYLVSLEERIIQALQIPYQVVMMCTGDLGVPAAKKYDIEMWMPGQGRYRETHSCSNCTDFQARRLNIRYRHDKAPLEFVHTLNGTAVAVGRTLIAILENYQQEDGSILVPEILRPYMKMEKIERRT